MENHNNTYVAPITLGFAPNDGDLIRGTVNGVEVNGQWIGKTRCASLYREGNTDVPLCSIEFSGEQAFVTVEQASAPTTDYELHLYRYVPAGIVQIPQRYVDGLEETTANANQALETATAAQSTADTAKSTADTAKSTADTAKSTADSAKSTADTAKSTADSAKSTADSAKSTASGAYPSSGQSTFKLKGNPTGISGNMQFVGIADNPIYCYVDRSSHSDAYAPARFAFKANGSGTMQVEGIDVLQMRSAGGKKFNLTVDDTGTISATEVT